MIIEKAKKGKSKKKEKKRKQLVNPHLSEQP
jgi:hypothetical protein